MDFTKGKWETHPSRNGIIVNGKLMVTCWAEDTNDLDERLDGESWLDMRKRTENERIKRTEFIPKANAQLIATAPKMLEMLIEIHSMLSSGTRINSDDIYEVINQATKID